MVVELVMQLEPFQLYQKMVAAIIQKLILFGNIQQTLQIKSILDYNLNKSDRSTIDAFKEQKRNFFEKPKVNYSKPEDVKPNNVTNTYLNVNDNMLKPNIDSSNEDKMKLEILTL